jgi:hypothetical protein
MWSTSEVYNTFSLLGVVDADGDGVAVAVVVSTLLLLLLLLLDPTIGSGLDLK